MKKGGGIGPLKPWQPFPLGIPVPNPILSSPQKKISVELLMFISINFPLFHIAFIKKFKKQKWNL